STPSPRSPQPSFFPYTTLFRSTIPSAGQVQGSICERRTASKFPPASAAPRLECTSSFRWFARPRCPNFHGKNSPDEGENCSRSRSEEHTSELQSRFDLVCRLLL